MINNLSLEAIMNPFLKEASSNDAYQVLPQMEPTNLSLIKKPSDRTQYQSVNKEKEQMKAATEKSKINGNQQEKRQCVGSTQNLDESHYTSHSQTHQLCDRQSLLQKRKSYSESVRQKNKCSLQEERGRHKKSINMNESMNLSYANTPPKDLINHSNHSRMIKNNSQIFEKSQNLSEVEKEYYTLNKMELESSDSQVFRECNSISQMNITAFENDTRSKSKAYTKQTNSIKMNSIDLSLSQIENNYNQSARKSTRNKENKPQTIPHSSARKASNKKYTSYAQIFDKKSTMNTLINSQKSKGIVNSVSRQMTSVKKDKQALRSMANPTEITNFQFANQHCSTNLDTIVNGFAIDEFVQEVEVKDVSKSNSCSVNINTQKAKKASQQNSIKDLQETLNKKPHQSKLKIYQTVSETIDFANQYQKVRKEEDKEIMTLAKQNTTFKRELAAFRKQNSTIKKELQKAKDYIKELQQKAKSLLEQQSSLKSYQRQNQKKISETMMEAQTEFSEPEFSCSNNLEQILISTEQEVFSLKNTNKALELKLYMLEKKLINEEELNKKRFAIQVGNWRDKYNKLRNQNMKLKNIRASPFMNNDFSISMDISRDE